MCTFAIPLVLSTLIGSGWALPSVNAGITNSALLEETLSWIVKPLSAMTISPATSLSINTQFLVKNLSDVLPPQVFDRNDMVTWIKQYSKHPHIRTLILEVRLIRFLYIGCLVKNQPEGVLKLFLKIGGGNQNCNKYTKKSLRLN